MVAAVVATEEGKHICHLAEEHIVSHSFRIVLDSMPQTQEAAWVLAAVAVVDRIPGCKVAAVEDLVVADCAEVVPPGRMSPFKVVAQAKVMKKEAAGEA
jgi:hypothetical protein